MAKICLSCGKCCLQTEMQLTSEDITRIESSTGKSWKEFASWDKKSQVILKNTNGHCFFFNEAGKTCNIYDVRPFGCQIYPVVFDFSSRRCHYDEDCPYPKQVSPPKFLAAKCRLIKKELPHFSFPQAPPSS